MKYSPELVERLWAVLRGVRTDPAYPEAFGLVETPFTVDLNYFEQEYAHNLLKQFSPGEKSLAQLVEEAESGGLEILYYHLSCAAIPVPGPNSALCIHYVQHGNKMATPFPGLTYKMPDFP